MDKKEEKMFQVLSIHYAGTHGTIMLLRHIIYIFKLYDIYLETLFTSFPWFHIRRWKTAIYSKVFHSAFVLMFVGGKYKTHTWLLRELYHQITKMCWMYDFSAMTTAARLRKVPQFLIKEKSKSFSQSTKNISHSFELSEKITTCEISFP